MPGALGRISAMEQHALHDVERLLGSVRFVPSQRVGRLLWARDRGWQWWVATLAVGASATAILGGAVFAFWHVLLGLRM